MATRAAKAKQVWVSKTTTLCVHHAFLYIALLSLHNYVVKLSSWIRKFSFREDLNTGQHLANWTKCNENDEVLIHSFSDVFAAAALLRVVAAVGFSWLTESAPRSLLFKFPNPFSVYPGTYYIMLNPAFTAHSLIKLTILRLLEP